MCFYDAMEEVFVCMDNQIVLDAYELIDPDLDAHDLVIPRL